MTLDTFRIGLMVRKTGGTFQGFYLYTTEREEKLEIWADSLWLKVSQVMLMEWNLLKDPLRNVF